MTAATARVTTVPAVIKAITMAATTAVTDTAILVDIIGTTVTRGIAIAQIGMTAPTTIDTATMDIQTTGTIATIMATIAPSGQPANLPRSSGEVPQPGPSSVR